MGDKLAVGTVGAIGSGQLAQELVEDGLDAVLVGRPFLKNPFLVWQFAEELGVQIQLANQIRYVSLFNQSLLRLTDAEGGALAVVKAGRVSRRGLLLTKRTTSGLLRRIAIHLCPQNSCIGRITSESDSEVFTSKFISCSEDLHQSKFHGVISETS